MSRIPTPVDLSNTSLNYLSGVTITAGSSAATGDTDFNGTRIGIGVRISSVKKFKVLVTPKNANGSAAIGVQDTAIDQSTTAADRASASYQLKSRRCDVSITNMDTVDLVVSQLTITDFRV